VSEQPSDDSRDDTADTEAAWRHIVDNYGERAVVEPGEYAEAPVIRRPEPIDPLDLDEDEEDLDEDGFVPPAPPPLPRTTPARLAAWLGVLGVPAVVVVLLVTGLHTPALLGWGLITAFVGGFGYLVATMPREPRDPWDDGSRI
jgi:hypothetical protein